MHDPALDVLGEDRFAEGSLRMAAVSMLMERILHRAGPEGRKAAARERVGHDMTSVLDGLFGGRGEHAPARIGGAAAGMEGLVHALRAHGLGRQVESWLGEGTKLAVTAEQVAPVFEGAAVERQALRAGADRESLLLEIARILPDFLDRVTRAAATGDRPTRRDP